MPTQQDINLIPQEEIHERQKVKAVHTSTIIAIILLVTILGATGYLYYKSTDLNSQIDSLDSEITSLRSKIGVKSQIEISARNLDKKYNTLETLMKEREYYSLLLEEMRVRKPDTLTIDSLNIRDGNKLNLNGTAENYISISNFANNLVAEDFSGGNPELSGLFTSVSLNSITLEKSDNTVEYLIIVEMDPEKLKDK